MPSQPDTLTKFQLLTSTPIRHVICTSDLPFQVPAQVFLEFAELDVQDSSPRGRANALSNAKRAIANRMDTLLLGCGLFGTARRQNWGFPERDRRLREIGYPSRDILKRMVNRPRNILDHDYAIPVTPEEVQDIVDLASLYLSATDPYVERGVQFAFVFSASSNVVVPSDIRRPDQDTDVLEFNLVQDSIECHSGNGWASFGPVGSEDIGEVALAAFAKSVFEARRIRPSIVVDAIAMALPARLNSSRSGQSRDVDA